MPGLGRGGGYWRMPAIAEVDAPPLAAVRFGRQRTRHLSERVGVGAYVRGVDIDGCRIRP
jgi:hypothetical protein